MGTGERSGDSLDVDETQRVETVHDGDDITVVVHDPEHPTHKHGARVAVIVAVAAVVLVVLGAWVIEQGRKDPKVITQHAAATPAAQQPVPPVAGAQPTTAPAASVPRASTGVTIPTSRVTTAPTRDNGGPNNGVVPPPQPPQQPSGPKTSPLEWSGPQSIAMHTGDTKTITISLTNPTDGTVSLPNALTCPGTWKLADPPMCAEIVQQIAPHAHLTTTVTIDATGASSRSYSTAVGGAYKITVTVS